MIMGYDDGGEEAGGASSPHIYYVDNSGQRIEGSIFAVGSGSTFALGILDTEFRSDLSVDEAIALGIKAIRHATFRDAYSGGMINIYHITREGWVKVYTDDISRG
jgi:20S proteasome subunit beta 5